MHFWVVLCYLVEGILWLIVLFRVRAVGVFANNVPAKFDRGRFWCCYLHKKADLEPK